MELLFDVLGLFSFYDRQAIEFINKLLKSTKENEFGEAEPTYDIKQILALLNIMLVRSARVEDTSVISHKSYIDLVHSLLSRIDNE